MNKLCRKCNNEKPIEEFWKDCCSKDGRSSLCKICGRAYHKILDKIKREKYTSLSIDILKSIKRICPKCLKEKALTEYYPRKNRLVISTCKECLREIRKSEEYKKKYSERDRNNGIRYNFIHKKEKSNYNKIYDGSHKKERNNRLTIRRKNDPGFKIENNLRGRILAAVRQQSTVKAYKTTELIGCTVPFLLKYIESKFTEGMTWQNHNRYGWHIDHIIPCAAFDLTKPEEQKKCFHYTNLQPMWSIDNHKKTSFYNGKFYKKT